MTKDKAFRKFERKRPLEATISAKLPAIKAGIKALHHDAKEEEGSIRVPTIKIDPTPFYFSR
ncbi:MAG: hypothetical protein ACLR35_07770 [Streptococcus salivarius]